VCEDEGEGDDEYVDEYESQEEGAGFVSACVVLVLDVLFPHHPHMNHHTVVHEVVVVLHVWH